MSYNTKQREILLQFFNNNPDKTFTAQQIAQNLKDEGISVSAVYRNLSTLEKLGKVRKTAQSGSRKALFMYVDMGKCKQHLHLSCEKCGKTMHLDDKTAEILENNIFKNSNFNVDKTNTIIYGVCKNKREKK